MCEGNHEEETSLGESKLSKTQILYPHHIHQVKRTRLQEDGITFSFDAFLRQN